ncbi:phage tail assembly protein [Salmonella enterica subsp. enterica serovar Typhi]|nr:phage tail assembly protein [Salmonella enterica subsp. enterica serovar Typhi]
MKIRAVKGIRNAHYLENGAVDCEVLFEGETEFVPYTAMQDDSAPTGQHVWEELQSGKWGEITPFTVTPELIAAAKDAKKMEIEAWRTEQEALPFTFEWNGRTWNAGPDSMARLYPVVMAAKSDTARTALAWGDADNQQVKLSMPELEELAAAMAQAQVDRNDEIYQRQREMKEELNNLNDLRSIRAMVISR